MQLTPEQEQKLHHLTDIFLMENEKLNLSAFRTQDQCYIGNVLDSLALLDIAQTLFGERWQQESFRILDIGTGGGFPLLPLAMLMPHSRFIGLDAVQKKVDAVERIAQNLELSNVKLVCRRSEEYAHKEDIRESFDLALCRAVAPIATLLEYAVPFLKVRSHCVFWKSMHIAEELRSSSQSGLLMHTKLIQSFPYTLPADWGERQLLVYEKQGRTSAEYPRRVGTPKSKPL